MSGSRIAIYLIHFHTHCALKYGLPEKLGLCDYEVSLSQYFILCLKFCCKLHLDQISGPLRWTLVCFCVLFGTYDLLENKCIDNVIKNIIFCFFIMFKTDRFHFAGYLFRIIK